MRNGSKVLLPAELYGDLRRLCVSLEQNAYFPGLVASVFPFGPFIFDAWLRWQAGAFGVEG